LRPEDGLRVKPAMTDAQTLPPCRSRPSPVMPDSIISRHAGLDPASIFSSHYCAQKMDCGSSPQ
ncbi:MAG: hypothetical protein Q9M13_05075, partial [Mariprofundales bacterium]|nr:hypothetical protein [Mariprofundales bacterium]